MCKANQSSSSKMLRWTPEETEKLLQMRKGLHKELSCRRQLPDVVGDRRLLRFLRGHGSNVEKATKMFGKFLQWRDEFDVDSIRDHILYSKMKSPNEFPCGRKILKHVPQIMLSHEALDNFGNPIALEHFSFVPELVLQEISKKEYITFMIYTLEYKILLLEQMADEREKKNLSRSTFDRSVPYGVIVSSRVIRDLEGFGLGHIGTDGQTVIKWILEIAVDNYPELLYRCHMVNVPWIFNSIWFFMKGLMDSNTVKKVTITGTDFYKELVREIPEHSIPKVLGGKFIPNNVLYDFDLSENGPFYYPGCPVSNDEKEISGISDKIKSDYTTPEEIYTPTEKSDEMEMEILKSDDEAADCEHCEETKIEKNFTDIDFNDSTCTSRAGSMKHSGKKSPRKVAVSSPAVDETEFNSSPAREYDNSCGIIFGKKDKDKERERYYANSDGRISPKSENGKGILGEVRSAEFSRRGNEKDLMYRTYHKMKNTGNILKDQLAHETHLGPISHILKIENMSKIGNNFNETRSRRDGVKKIGYGKTAQKKTNSSSRRCTDVQSMAQEKNCRATCSIQ